MHVYSLCVCLSLSMSVCVFLFLSFYLFLCLFLSLLRPPHTHTEVGGFQSQVPHTMADRVTFLFRETFVYLNTGNLFSDLQVRDVLAGIAGHPWEWKQAFSL